jgi:hypothetical protein
MSFIKRLFASPKIVETTVESAIKGIDKVFYTDEEKAEARQKALNLYEKMWLAAVPSALSRRLIACTVTFTWAFVIVFMLAAAALDNYDLARFAFDLLETVIINPFSIIVGFYFLTNVVQAVKGK